MEKKRIVILGLALALALPAQAQDLVYALPNTVLTLKVEVQQETFFAGPYASYAKKYLNMDVQEEDGVTSTVTSIELIPGIEADLQSLNLCEADNAALLALSSQGLVCLPGIPAQQAAAPWRFPAAVKGDFSSASATSQEKVVTNVSYKSIQAEDGEMQIPVEHKVKETKSIEDKAADAAEMILTVRRSRLDIVSGNTDASYTGEAMGAALQELDRIEKEYMTLFCGYSVSGTIQASFDVIPDPSLRVHRYLAFRVTDDGPVSDGVRGVPYYVELEPGTVVLAEDDEKKGRSKGTPVKYRIPALCHVTVTRDGTPLLESRVPVYQLGQEALMTLNR